MSANTAANRLAGGPKLFIASLGVALPDLDVDTLVWSNNAVQTMSDSGTVSGGTYTIAFKHPTTGVEEITAAIAFDANAATVQAALVALSGIDSGDVVVTGTTPDLVFTFGGNLANTPIQLMVVDSGSLTGGGSYSIAVTTVGRLWTQLPDTVNEFKVAPVHNTEKHRPVYLPHHTDSITTDIGIDTVSFSIGESDVDAMNIALASSLKVTTGAGAGTVGKDTLTQPLAANIGFIQMVAQYTGPAGGWGILRHLFALKRKLDQEQTHSTGRRLVPFMFEAYADETTGTCEKWYEYLAAATS